MAAKYIFTITFLVGLVCSHGSSAEYEKILIGGTGGALGALKNASLIFMNDHPGVKVVVLGSLGSKGGIRALLSKKLDIAVATRAPNATENMSNLVSRPYARTPVVFVTSTRPKNLDFTMNEMIQMFNRESRWRDGNSVRPVVRPLGSANTKMLIKDNKRLEDAIVQASKWAYVAFSEQEAADDLEQIQGSLGYLSFSVVMGENRKLFVLNIEGIEPWSANDVTSTYPFVKTFHMITWPNPKPAVQEFVSFLSSSPGQRILQQAGQVGISPAK